MKRKIVLYMLALFIFSAIGALYATLSINTTVNTLSELVTIHHLQDAGLAQGASGGAEKELAASSREALEKIKRAWYLLTAIMLLTFLFGVILTVFLIRAVTRPVDILVNATRTIAWGNLGYTIPYQDKTEFGELAKNFNDMSVSLQNSYAKLETEINERKRTEAALRESEERYALAASGANDGLWDWDLRNDTVYYSYRWKTMLGYSDKELGDQPAEWFTRVHPDDLAELESKIAAHVNGRSPHFEGEYRIMHKDGTYRWVLSRGLAVRTLDGHAYRMAGSQTDITLRKKAEEQLVYDAFHDTLTGLPNRSLFLNRLQHVIATSRRRTDVRYAVLFLDLDRFKIINDSLGHGIGDELLSAVGRRLSDCLRPGDTIARLGGDEFAVLLANISELKDAIDVTERIHKNLAIPIMVQGHEVVCSISIGVALGAAEYERPEQVLRDADIAMYLAKAKGSGCYEVFNAEIHAKILDRQQLEADLRRALDEKQLLLHYQPIINLKTRKLIGFEVLVRWDHPKRGLLYPLEFIPLAEENGLINVMGEWILRESCREMRVMQDRYPVDPPLKMSVNISGKQFDRRDLADTVSTILDETGLNPSTLVFEITESMIMENVDAAIATMGRLRDMGVHIHIDDFGTGYSSLSYLHNFPINALKIDRSFINKLSTTGENQEIILSIISLAKSLNFDVIAEGVELTHQLSTIEDLRCQYGQGFLFAQPMGLHEIDVWVKSENYLN